MILIRGLSGKRSPFTPVGLLRIIANALCRLSGYHVGCSGYMLDGAVTSEQPLAQAVMTVAESGLPRDNRVWGIVERSHDRVWHLASVFLGEHATGHERCARFRQIERGHDPSDLVHHVLGHVSAGKLPVQPPVDKLERIEFAIGMPVQKGFPVDILRSAIRGHLAHPLTFTVRCVAAHPRLHLGNLPYNSVLDPLPGICE